MKPTSYICTLVTSSPSAFTTISIGHGPASLLQQLAITIFSQYPLHLLRGLRRSYCWYICNLFCGQLSTKCLTKQFENFQVQFICVSLYSRNVSTTSQLVTGSPHYIVHTYTQIIITTINKCYKIYLITESSTDSVTQPRVHLDGQVPI